MPKDLGLAHDGDALQPDGLMHAVVGACRLISASDGATIRSVVIVGGRRPTGADAAVVALGPGMAAERGKGRPAETWEG